MLPKIELPNLDAIDEDELVAFLDKADRWGPRSFALALFPDQPEGYATAARLIVHYAWTALGNKRITKYGGVNAAKLFSEAMNDLLKPQIPAYARWWEESSAEATPTQE